jgi:hypothetical protein
MAHVAARYRIPERATRTASAEMNYITYIVAGLFAIKIIWNLIVPYDLAIKSLRAKDGRRPGTSLMPLVELGLLGGIAALSSVDGRALWSWTVGRTLFVGVTIIIASYTHMLVAGILAGWIISRIRKRPGR